MINVGIIAPSSVVPKVEFEIGVQYLKDSELNVTVHPTVLGQHYFYPASDEDRARAFLDYTFNDDIDALWCARGGYGATQLLPFLEKVTRKRKPKRKVLLGYSDATALLEFVRTQWGWETIHAPMPSLRTFSILKEKESGSLLNYLTHACNKEEKLYPTSFKLEWVYKPKIVKTVQAPLVGGNLAVWNSLIGTPYAGAAAKKILFFEDIQENIPRVNRMLHQLEQSGGLKDVEAIVLGDFLECNDSVAQCLESPLSKKLTTEERETFLRHPPKEAMITIRKLYAPEESLDYVFRSLGERTRIPVLKGVPVGHGPHYFPLYLGKKHTLSMNGNFSIVR
jgi:muramoyltetrapeptide carboxypeptidase